MGPLDLKAYTYSLCIALPTNFQAEHAFTPEPTPRPFYELVFSD